MTRVLVVNTGSSSLKLRVIEDDGRAPVASAHVADWDGRDVAPVADVAGQAGAIAAVGHRVVHGGAELTQSTLIDDTVVARIEALTPLAPLHQGRALAGIAAATTALPGVPQVACFDTAFHATLPAAARTYALPAAWRDRWDLRRFGFHGLSHAYAVGQAALLVGRVGDPDLRVVCCHLGAGASLCAARGGRSVDPGLLLWLLTAAGMSAAEVNDGLETASGLAGLAGTPDMREVLLRDDAAARLAVEVYVHRLAREIAAMTASLGGLDVLVFTGGVGENAPEIRHRTTERLPHLVTAEVTTVVVEAREDLAIASQVGTLLRL